MLPCLLEKQKILSVIIYSVLLQSDCLVGLFHCDLRKSLLHFDEQITVNSKIKLQLCFCNFVILSSLTHCFPALNQNCVSRKPQIYKQLLI